MGNNDDLNYSFLSRTFSSLSKNQKDKILQILNNTAKFEKSWLIWLLGQDSNLRPID